MKRLQLLATVLSIALGFILSACDSNEHVPLPTNSKSCNIEIECVNATGENLLADKTFTDKIKIEGENSHSFISHTVQNNRLCFEADLPDQKDMKWSSDRREATGMSKITVKFGKQKASLRCMLKYTANRPPAAPGGSMVLEEVEYKGRTYKRTGGAVIIRIQFDINGKL
ncbi:MAG: hypothetical protein K2N48_14275 [Muribaculaceae bacterium]|nr:hypothetical protein [Muribaculaceae bacterium]